MQIALEKDLRLSIQMLAAQSDRSMKDWILDNILTIHRNVGIETYLSQTYGSALVLAPPTNVKRFNILIDDPVLDLAIEDIANQLQRTKPQIVYTLITNIVSDKNEQNSVTSPQPSQSLIA